MFFGESFPGLGAIGGGGFSTPVSSSATANSGVSFGGQADETAGVNGQLSPCVIVVLLVIIYLIAKR